MEKDDSSYCNPLAFEWSERLEEEEEPSIVEICPDEEPQIIEPEFSEIEEIKIEDLTEEEDPTPSTSYEPDIIVLEEDDGRLRYVTKCQICENQFYGKDQNSVKSSLRRHFKFTHATDAVPLFACEFCDNSYRSRGTLNDHVISKHTDAKFKCDICSKPFESKRMAKRHQKITHGADKEQCEICNTWTKPAFMQRHVRIVHQKAELCQCQICDKAFQTASSLKRHVKDSVTKIALFSVG